MESHEKHFSLEEAKETLDEIRPKIQKILELKHDLDAMGFDITSKASYSNVDSERVQEVEKKVVEIEELLSEIEKTGAIFKDPTFELGTVDFPYLRNGKEIYLCWMLGEEDLKYWHPIETGMAGRKPIEKL